MCPSTLAMPVCKNEQESIYTEAILSLNHIESILAAWKLSTENIIQTICYCTRKEYIPIAEYLWKERVDNKV